MVASPSFAEFLREQLAPLGHITIDLALWRVPERLFDDPDEFIAWARRAGGGAPDCSKTRTHGASTKITGATASGGKP